MMLVDNWLHYMRSSVFAPVCLLCHAPASLELDLCPECLADLPWQPNACPHCALTLSAGSPAGPCGDCLRRPRFDTAIAAFEYTAPVDWLITRLKFNHRLAHARLLGALLADRIATARSPLPDCILPAPLHPSRYRDRGFNQATLIARSAARTLELAVKPELAKRNRNTAPQRSLPAGQRKQNVRNAFTARDDCAGRHIAIVDDVVTTAHTAASLAAALDRSDAASVQLWCVARA